MRPLGEVFEIGSSKRVLQKQWQNEGVPFYRAREIVRLAKYGSVENDLYISEKHFAELKETHGVPKPGDLMVSAVGTLGACYVVQPQDRFYFKDASVLHFQPRMAVCSKFYQYAFQWNGLLKTVQKSDGATVGTLTISRAGSIPVPLPPLEEQQRIVAILDEAFEGLDRARANAEANLQNARELFDELVNDCFQSVDEKAVASTTLGRLAEFRNGLNYSRASRGRTVKIVGVGDFKDRLTVPVDTLSEIAVDGELSLEDQLRTGDLLAVRSNGNRELIGRTMLVPELSDVISFSGFTIRIRLVSDQLLPEYLCEFMRTKAVRKLLFDGGGGANISNLNQRLLSGLPVAFPSVRDQQSMLEKLGEMRSRTTELVKRVESKLQDITDLRQSLLQKAFAGELT